MKEIQGMDLLNKMRKRIPSHSSYSPNIKKMTISDANELQEKLEVFQALDDANTSLNVIQTHVKNVQNEARAIQILSSALSFCTHLQEYEVGYISKEDKVIASNYLLDKALSNERATKSIKVKLAKIKERLEP